MAAEESALLPKSGNIKQSFWRWLGISISLGCFFWVVYHIHPERLIDNIQQMEWRWVLVAICFDTLSYLLQGLRWRFLLLPITRIPYLKVLQAIYIGLFINGVLPLRSGKWLRAYLVSRWGNTTVSQVLSTIFFEWYFEWTVLVTTVVISSIYFPFPPRLQETGKYLSIAMISMLTIAIISGYLGKDWWKERLNREFPLERRRGRVQDFMSTFIKGLAVIGRSHYAIFSLLVATLMPFTHTAALWSLLNAYNLDQPYMVALVLYFIINLGTAIPNAPANVGSFQLAVVVGLTTIFGIDKNKAAEFSVVAFIILSLPYLLIGFISLMMTGISLKDLKARQAQESRDGEIEI
jgi:glycosyltransferase 2 family protein